MKIHKKMELLILSVVFLGAGLIIPAQVFALPENPDPVIQALLMQITRLKQQINDIILQRSVAAGSYLVADIASGSVVSQRNADKAYPIASITKLMNAVVAVENINLDQNIILEKEMLKPYGHSPSLFLGLQVSAKNLLKASLIQSVNDAAESLSYFSGHEAFLALMNQKARELGMANTYFYSTHGLNPSNRSTSSDLVKLVTYIYQKHPEILSITKDDDFWLPDPTGKLLKFKNLNVFLSSPDFVGGKTGYLPEAKESFASLFLLNGKPTAVVLLYSADRQTDVANIINQLKALPY